jgi:hypothetical protein
LRRARICLRAEQGGEGEHRAVETGYPQPSYAAKQIKEWLNPFLREA